MKDNTEYVNLLKKLLVQLQVRTGQVNEKADEILTEASNWKCPDKKEKHLLNDVIRRAQQYLELENLIHEKSYKSEDYERYFSYLRWFNSLKMLIDTFDVPLSKLSFNEMALKE